MYSRVGLYSNQYGICARDESHQDSIMHIPILSKKCRHLQILKDIPPRSFPRLLVRCTQDDFTFIDDIFSVTIINHHSALSTALGLDCQETTFTSILKGDLEAGHLKSDFFQCPLSENTCHLGAKAFFFRNSFLLSTRLKELSVYNTTSRNDMKIRNPRKAHATLKTLGATLRNAMGPSW